MIHEARHTIATVVILFTSSCAAVFADSVPDGVPAESLLGVHIRYMDAIEDGDHGAVKAITSQVNEAIDTISGADTIRGTSLRRLMVDFQRDVATLQRLRERRPDLVTTITESFTSVCRAAASEERRTTIATAGELINVIDKAQIQLPEIVDACYSTAAFAAYCLGDYEINIRSSELHLDYCRQTWGESSWKYGRALFYRSMSCTDCYQDNERLVETLQTAKALMDPIKTIYPIEVFMVSNQIALRLNRERRYQEALHETDDAMALLNTLPDLDGFGA
ncbi:MAG: hypothetical protein NT069_20790 [Planctomycetota bacterium]|nr:hypothetical protein [Planctomycetota bacterium]